VSTKTQPALFHVSKGIKLPHKRPSSRENKIFVSEIQSTNRPYTTRKEKFTETDSLYSACLKHFIGNTLHLGTHTGF